MFVAGGLSRLGKAIKSIEVLNEKLLRWEIFGAEFNKGVLSFISHVKNNDEIIFFGGNDN